VYFSNILQTLYRHVNEITDNELYFRRYHPIKDGKLGPQYNDCEYTPHEGHSGGMNKYDIFPDSGNILTRLTKFIVTSENAAKFNYKSIMTNEEYYLQHNNKCIYMDIMATLEGEHFFPQRLSKDEYNKAFTTIKDNPMSLQDMKEKYEEIIDNYDGEPHLICKFDDAPITGQAMTIATKPLKKKKQRIVDTTSKASKIIELIMEILYFVTETTMKTLITTITKLFKIYDILMH
jgi:hypothetical protein